MIRLAILASGRGTNAENLVHFIRSYPQLVLATVITDRPQALVRSKMESLGITCEVVALPRDERPFLERKKQQERALLQTLQACEVEWVLLAGYQRLLSESFIEQFWDVQNNHSRIVNIHPSLLPSYPGLEAYERIFAAKEAEGGVTVHLVDAGMDSGPIVLQRSFPRKKDDDWESFHRRGLALEHKLYPEALKKLFKLESVCE